jgi:radical SAM superfamily enzyme YgiQ (UPF0313 family)
MLKVLKHDGAICAALFGIESIQPQALRNMAKAWNGTGAEIEAKVQQIQAAGIHVLGSMIVGLPTDTRESIDLMRQFALRSGMSVAQFPTYQLFPGSPDYKAAQRELLRRDRVPAELPIVPETNGPAVKLLRDEYWLEADQSVPYLKHPVLDSATIQAEDRASWRNFYQLSHLLQNGIRRGWPLRTTVTYAAACKGFARFYGGAVGLSTDSARANDASFFQRKLMALGARLMHKIPPPPAL